MIERLICNWTLGSSGTEYEDIFDIYTNEENNPQALLHFRIWISRKVAIFFSCLVLLYKALTFKDYNVINYQMLQNIHQQNAELCKAVQLMKSKDVIDHQAPFVQDVSDADDEDSEDDLSFQSNATDTTWRGPGDFSDDEEDFQSLDTTPTNDLVELKQVVPVESSLDMSDKPPIKRRGRPPGSSRNSSRCATPVR